MKLANVTEHTEDSDDGFQRVQSNGTVAKSKKLSFKKVNKLTEKVADQLAWKTNIEIEKWLKLKRETKTESQKHWDNFK